MERNNYYIVIAIKSYFTDINPLAEIEFLVETFVCGAEEKYLKKTIYAVR